MARATPRQFFGGSDWLRIQKSHIAAAMPAAGAAAAATSAAAATPAADLAPESSVFRLPSFQSMAESVRKPLTRRLSTLGGLAPPGTRVKDVAALRRAAFPGL